MKVKNAKISYSTGTQFNYGEVKVDVAVETDLPVGEDIDDYYEKLRQWCETKKKDALKKAKSGE